MDGGIVAILQRKVKFVDEMLDNPLGVEVNWHENKLGLDPPSTKPFFLKSDIEKAIVIFSDGRIKMDGEAYFYKYTLQ